MKETYLIVDRQIKRIRKLYSQIGEPLDTAVLIDLYRHLGKALPDPKAEKSMPVRRKKAN